MKLSLLTILEEIKSTPIFKKVRVGLFERGESSYTASEEGGYKPKDTSLDSKIEEVYITPVMSGRNPKLNELFQDDELWNLKIRWENSNNTYYSIICKEGILLYYYEADADYSYSSWSEGIIFTDISDKNWDLIKEKIKPVLEQSDLDEAIKSIGDIKKISNQYNKKFGGDIRKYRQRELGLNSSLWYPSNDYEILRTNNGKYGVFISYRQKNKVIIPPIFDSLVKIDKVSENVDCKYCHLYKGQNGNYVFTIKVERGKISILKKQSYNELTSKLVGYLYRKYLKQGDSLFDDITKYGEYDWWIAKELPFIDNKKATELIIGFLKNKIKENEKVNI